jgi:UDP-N-acetylglucosamine 2-epimerase (non-hydrolysing)
LLDALDRVTCHLPVVFPLHPRTRKQLERHRLGPGDRGEGRVRFVDPLGYLDFLALMSRARLVLTDSGGIQEETTILGVPCLTLRENTERPVTISHGTNRLVGTDPAAVEDATLATLCAPVEKRPRPPLWDGRAATRIVDVLVRRPRVW